MTVQPQPTQRRMKYVGEGVKDLAAAIGIVVPTIAGFHRLGDSRCHLTQFVVAYGDHCSVADHLHHGNITDFCDYGGYLCLQQYMRSYENHSRRTDD